MHAKNRINSMLLRATEFKQGVIIGLTPKNTVLCAFLKTKKLPDNS